MGRPVTTHTKMNTHREKIRRLAKLMADKMEGEINTMAAENRLEGWDAPTPENLVAKRKELRSLVNKATVGRTPNLETKVCLLTAQIAYLHNESIRSEVEKGY